MKKNTLFTVLLAAALVFSMAVTLTGVKARIGMVLK